MRIWPILKNNLALIALGSLAIFALFIIVALYRNVVYVLCGMLVLLCSFVWLAIRNRISSDCNFFLSCNNKTLSKIFSIMFYLSVVITILLIYLNSNAESRSPILFFIFILTALIVALNIAFYGDNHVQILIQVSIFGALLSASQVFLFPNVVGVDPWWHQMFTYELVNLGHVPIDYLYSSIPLYHIYIAAVMAMLDMGFKISSFLGVNLLLIVLSSLMVYSISQLIIGNKRISELSSLILIVGDYFNRFAIFSIPNTLGIIFVILGIFSLFKIKSRNDQKYFLIIMILIIDVTGTHALCALFLSISFVSFVFARYISNKIYLKDYADLPLYLFVLPLIVMFFWWSYFSEHLDRLGYLLKIGFSANQYPIPSDIFRLLNADHISIPLYDVIFNSLGQYLFFSLSLIGIFFLISRKCSKISSDGFVFAFLASVPVVIAFISLMIGMSLVQDRWWFFSQFFICILVALSINLLSKHFSSKFSTKLIFYCLLVLLVVSLLLLNHTSTLDKSIIFPETSIRSGITESEIFGAKFVSCKYTGFLFSDFDYATNPSGSVYLNYYNYNTNNIRIFDGYIVNRTIPNDNGIIVIRDYITKNRFRTIWSTYNLNYDILQLYDSGTNRIYASGESGVSIYPVSRF